MMIISDFPFGMNISTVSIFSYELESEGINTDVFIC